jgi:hypothetical protein
VSGDEGPYEGRHLSSDDRGRERREEIRELDGGTGVQSIDVRKRMSKIWFVRVPCPNYRR